MTTAATYVPPTVTAERVERVESGHHVRRRRWSDGGLDHVHLSGPTDTSPVHSTYPTGYRSGCGWCWLGAPHTADAHHLALNGPVIDTAEYAGRHHGAES